MVEDAISFWTDIQRYEDMLAADPHSYCFAPLSELYRKLGLLDDAISVAQKGCAQHPDYAGGFFALGAAYYHKGMRSEARQALEQVMSLKPGHLQALRLLGQLLVETGEIEQARKALAALLKEDPNDTESALLLRSIASSPARPQPEEDVLEDLDVIEELEVVEEAEPAQPQRGLQDVAQALAEYDWVGTPSPAAEPARPAPPPAGAANAAAPAAPAPAQADDDLEDLWAIEAFDDVEEQRQPEPPSAPVAPASPAAAQPVRDPLSTATLAELYVSQGFSEKAIVVYQELLSADPGNEAYRTRLSELRQAQEHPVAAGAAVAAPVHAPAAEPEAALPEGDLEAQLSNWLDNIRRRRDGV